MDTSGSSTLFATCFVLVVAVAAMSVRPLLMHRLSVRRLPAAGWVLWCCVAVPSLLQIPFPQVYDAFHRDASAIVDDHQWWRLATSITVQDGGIAGTVSNLVLLAATLVACLPLWGPTATVATFVLAGVTLNLAAVLLGATDGGGNSAATLALVASLPAFALAVGSGEERIRGAVGCAVTAASAIALIVGNDFHGLAVGLGLLLGLAGGPIARARWIREPPHGR